MLGVNESGAELKEVLRELLFEKANISLLSFLSIILLFIDLSNQSIKS